VQAVEQPVPVTMGSQRFVTRDVSALQVTLASFPPCGVLEPHIHERPTFAVMLEGAFDLRFTSPAIRRRTLSCPPGTIFTEPAGEKHANYLGHGGARLVVVQPDVHRGDLPRRCLTLLEGINHFRDGPIEATARRLAIELSRPDDLTPLATEGLALEMLAEAARLDNGHRLSGHAAPAWLQLAIEFAHAHFRGPVRVADVAEVAGVHPAHLAAVFRRVHRMPLASYMRRLRVDWSADRLLTSSDPISIIAASAGFADQAHLTRSFRRVTGTTPAAYRQAHRGRGPAAGAK